MAQIREKRSYRGGCAGEKYSGRVTNETKGRGDFVSEMTDTEPPALRKEENSDDNT